MKVNLLNSGILRTSQLSYNQTLEESWPELKRAIQYSSKAFFQIIKDIDYDSIKSLDPKAQYTIWKYFNRAKYRATPYGYFGSCSTLKISSEARDSQIVIEEEPDIISFIDWPYKNHLHFNHAQYFSDERIYISNESIYYTAGSIRYIFRHEKLFELASIDRDEFIESLLTFCRTPVSLTKLSRYLEGTAGLSVAEIEDLLKELLGHQLLYTDLSPNIIGPDYFERIGVEKNREDLAYILSRRTVIEGTLSKEYFRHFNECLALLLSCAEEVKPADLNTFKKNFIARFEDQEIALLNALDPELGVGYGDLAQSDNPDDILELSQAREADAIRKVIWGKLEVFLLKNMIEAGDNPNHIIRLEDFEPDVARVPAKPLPNTFSALVHVIDDLVIVESIGGSTASSLLGRFTRSDAHVKDLCKQLVKIESDANPDVIFFDIGYLSEDQVDNVNRRDAVYDYELPILVYSCSANPVHLQDIFVRVQNDEVILYSRQYRKRLIPRLATAYNYQRSDLSLYRFLCDLQHQGITSQLNFDLADKIPGAKFYPRVQYKNIVLSPAKSIIRVEHFKNSDCKDLLEKAGVKSWFKVRNNDQTLNFNMTREEDLLSFKHYINQQKQDFFIEESFQPEIPVILDDRRNPYLPQLVLSFYHEGLIYRGTGEKSSYITAQKGGPSATILPGNDWLYLEIYCHPLSSDNLLKETIQPLISKHQEDIATWFFIRYLKPGYHLRLRMQLMPGADSYSILNAFTEAMKNVFDDGQITDIQVKPYKRELERYGSDLIEQIEQHFYVDSVFILEVLHQECPPSQIYQLAVAIGLKVMQDLELEPFEQLSLVQYYLDNFIREHKWEFKEFKNLNKRYASFQKLKNEVVVSGSVMEKQSALNESFKDLLVQCSGERQKKLYGDLFHMLINRLFAEYQRTHEGLIYYFMVKELQKQVRINALYPFFLKNQDVQTFSINI